MSPIEHIDEGRIWLQWLKRPPRPTRTLVWFPFGGGLAHTAKALSNALPADWAMVGVEGPGRLRTTGEPIPDIEALADYYCRELGWLLGGAVLVGHSVGGLVAAMVAQRLERRGTPAEALIMGAARPPHTIPGGRPIAGLDDGGLFDWWQQMAVDPRTRAEERQLFELHRPMIRADLDVYDSAKDRPLEWNSTPALLVLGARDRICPVSVEQEWHRVAPDLRIEHCDGSHLFVLEMPEDYAARIVGFLDALQPLAEEERVPPDASARPGSAAAAGPDREAVREALQQDGIVHLRQCGIAAPDQFVRLLEALGFAPMPYELGNSPRSHLGSYVYTSSEYSATLPISPHCELSYTLSPPGLIAFCCLEPAAQGGETILVRMDEVIDDLPGRLVSRFADEGILYEQQMPRRPSLGRTWPATFDTEDPGEAERALIERGVPYEWRDGRETLVVWHRGPGVIRDGERGRSVWFNQADQWHRSALPEEIRAVGSLLPHDCRFGGGGAIEADEIATVREALDRHSVDLPLGAGEVLLLDNTRIGHGRRPFSGRRNMLVAMSQPRRARLCEGGAQWM